MATYTRTVSLDALVYEAGLTETLSLDAILYASVTKPIGLDAVLIEAVFPDINPWYEISKTTIFRTDIIQYGNKIEQRIARDSNARYRFSMQWSVLTEANAKTIMDFFEWAKGTLKVFYLPYVPEAFDSPVWSATTAYNLGNIVRPSTATRHSYKCVTAGTSGGTEPTWPTVSRATVADGSAAWQENSYVVRFEDDTLTMKNFIYNLYKYQKTTFIEVGSGS